MNDLGPHIETLLTGLDMWQLKVLSHEYPPGTEHMVHLRIEEISAARNYLLDINRAIKKGNQS